MASSSYHLQWPYLDVSGKRELMNTKIITESLKDLYDAMIHDNTQ